MSQFNYVCNGDSCTISVNESTNSSTNRLPSVNPSDDWTIYGTSTCSYCTKAKEYLRSLKQKFTFIDVSNYSDGRKSLQNMANGYRTVPVIYKKAQFIGGYTDLCNLKL